MFAKNKRVAGNGSENNVLLLLEVPRTNDKKELSAEQMFAALHGILERRPKKFPFNNNFVQKHLSFEIVSINSRIYFYVYIPADLQDFVESQIYAHYPNVKITAAEQDYSQREVSQEITYSVELDLKENENIPIKTFNNFDVDPLSGITASLSRLGEGEEVWIQILARPISDEWHKNGQKYIRKIRNPSLNIMDIVKAPAIPLEDGKSKEQQLGERDRVRVNAVQEKNIKLGYRIKIRIVYLGHDPEGTKIRMQAVLGAFKQFNTNELNGFRETDSSFDRAVLTDYRERYFHPKEGFILNIEELASVYHLPHTNVDTPNIVWVQGKTAEPPSNLPTKEFYDDYEISLFGQINFRNLVNHFGILRKDRGRHIYIIGQTGTGKSGLLELLALSDIKENQGYAIVDPHGDFAINNINHIPESRIKDVIYFNPADTDCPVGFNPLETTDSRQKVNISSDLVGVMKRMFDSWGPRLEYILRYTILALLDTPNTTMLDITRMLTDKTFRKRVVKNIEDIVVANFWKNEFSNWDNKYQNEAIAPVLNKVGAFTANPMIRNIIGQPKSSFDIRKIMDEGKILVVNLSRGLVGEDNAAILGAMLITKIQLAAMSRADISRIEDRRPFYLYVDEFQNFATDSFAVILSEARKYGLFLTLANQYIDQMPPEVRSAVFGNVGSIFSFRVSADDGPFLEKYFKPYFETGDIINLANRHLVISMTIQGEKAIPFSASTLSLDDSATLYNNLDKIVVHSRKLYATDKEVVEAKIRENTESSHQQPNNQPQQAQNQPKKQPSNQQPGQSPNPKQQVNNRRPNHQDKHQKQAQKGQTGNQTQPEKAKQPQHNNQQQPHDKQNQQQEQGSRK